MADGDIFNMAEEFGEIDFNDKRLGERFRKTMETLAKDPQKSIYGSCATRAESKAIYNLLGNEKFDRGEIIKAHRIATIRRMEGRSVILAVQDTTSVNYNTQQEMAGNGYISDKTMGVNIHSALAVTPEGLVLGVMDQTGFNRPEPKNTNLTREQQKNRPIEEKESNRWLVTMENFDSGIPPGTKVIHVRDREGDIYELFDRAIQSGRCFLVRIVHNRMTSGNVQIPDKIRETPCKSRVKVLIPRDSRRNLKERETVLQIRYAQYGIKRPEIKNKNKTLLPSLKVNVIYVKEEKPPAGIEAIEWFLMTNGEVVSDEAAYEKVEYYIRRWKIERFHYVLKSGCKIEKLQERSMERMKVLILMYSVIAVYIMNLTYIARINPGLPCTILFEETEWKLLCRAANRTKKTPCGPYTIKEAVDYIGWLGGPKRAPGDGPPGVKTIWTGLQKFYTLLDYRELFDFVGQV
ncbi:IS4 family transposase [Spirochaetia bacterium]|nr:IS4 family transposase [Spirochaetia bacterium]